MRKQRVIGVVLVLISVIGLALAATGKTFEDHDTTFALLILPLGLYMMFTKEYILY